MSAGRDWRDRAACRGVDPELFFPVGAGEPAGDQTARAKAVCARCPVRSPCLEFALAQISEGVAGGLSAEERTALHKQRRRVAGVAERPGLVPSGVDALVVAALVAGQTVAGASRAELACAAVALHEAGRLPGWIATQLGVPDKQVRRWVDRARAGMTLNPAPGRGRAGAAGVDRGPRSGPGASRVLSRRGQRRSRTDNNADRASHYDHR